MYLIYYINRSINYSMNMKKNNICLYLRSEKLTLNQILLIRLSYVTH